MGRRLSAGAAWDVCVCVAGFAESLCHGASIVSRTRSARNQTAVLHPNRRRICIRIRGSRTAGLRHGGEENLARRADFVFVIWKCVRAGDYVGRGVFASARPSHAAVCAGAPAHAAGACLVGRGAQPGSAGSGKTTEFRSGSKALALTTGRRGALAFDRRCSGGSVSFERSGLERDCGSGGAGAGGDTKFYPDLPRGGIRRRGPGGVGRPKKWGTT